MTLKDFLDVEIRPMMKQLGYRKAGGLFHRQNESFVYTDKFFTPPSATNDTFSICASILSLAIKKEDALFLGVTEDVYDKYLDYVVRLNEQLSENRRN